VAVFDLYTRGKLELLLIEKPRLKKLDSDIAHVRNIESVKVDFFDLPVLNKLTGVITSFGDPYCISGYFIDKDGKVIGNTHPPFSLSLIWDILRLFRLNRPERNRRIINALDTLRDINQIRSVVFLESYPYGKNDRISHLRVLELPKEWKMSDYVHEYRRSKKERRLHAVISVIK